VRTNRRLPLDYAPHSSLKMKTQILGNEFLKSKVKEDKLIRRLKNVICTRSYAPAAEFNISLPYQGAMLRKKRA
jgi:hypothetical protein